MKKLFLFVLAVSFTSAFAQTPTVIAPADVQIKTALLAAPADKREGATIYGYDDKNNFVTLRKGTNELICLADDPARKGLSVACYHRDLEPFMKRGRDLRKEGKKPMEVEKIRDEEAQAKKFPMPAKPTTLYVYSAKDENYTPATGEVKDGYLRYVVYTPFATPESIGLSTKAENPGQPWLMDAGTYRAHIMINPPVSTTAVK